MLNRENGSVEHTNFSNLFDFLKSGDLLVLHDTKVLPARIFGKRTDTGSEVEFVLLKRKSDTDWECIAGPGKKAKVGHKFTFSDKLSGEVIEVLPDGNRILKFGFEGEFYALLNEVGNMPLPHYIKEELKNKDRYQTVYSKELGSAAVGIMSYYAVWKRLEDKLVVYHLCRNLWWVTILCSAF